MNETENQVANLILYSPEGKRLKIASTIYSTDDGYFWFLLRGEETKDWYKCTIRLEEWDKHE